MFKKGQAALEFLTTYGWAFLVILVMIGALAYFGVLNPSRFVPDTCTFSSAFICDDHVVKTNEVIVKLRNNVETIVITNVTINDLDAGVIYAVSDWSQLFFTAGGCTVATDNATCTGGSVFTLTFNAASMGTFPTFTAGLKKKFSVDLKYYAARSGPGFGRSTGGDVVGTVQ